MRNYGNVWISDGENVVHWQGGMNGLQPISITKAVVIKKKIKKERKKPKR